MWVLGWLCFSFIFYSVYSHFNHVPLFAGTSPYSAASDFVQVVLNLNNELQAIGMLSQMLANRTAVVHQGFPPEYSDYYDNSDEVVDLVVDEQVSNTMLVIGGGAFCGKTDPILLVTVEQRYDRTTPFFARCIFGRTSANDTSTNSPKSTINGI